MPESLEVANVPSKKFRDVNFSITWNNEYSEADKAEIKVLNQEGTEIISVGIVPNARALPLVKNIKFDGDFADWPSSAKLPEWSIGKIGTPKNIELYLAYSQEGLYVGAKIDPSVASGSNPKVFWSMDCLEVCIDTKNDKQKRDKYSETDHQFWIVPMVKENKVYVGRWKRNDEIPKTKYDMQGIKSFSKKIKNGYTMEVLIPADKIKGFKPSKGNKIGLAINLTAPGRKETITCYWPLPKTEGVIEKPYIWAVAEMK
ncbi:MAG: sugar-binding protein [Verrucomicrobiota bacterium]|nr:sugar-binding protein [Verrucomicrobiota bacterium]